MNGCVAGDRVEASGADLPVTWQYIQRYLDNYPEADPPSPFDL